MRDDDNMLYITVLLLLNKLSFIRSSAMLACRRFTGRHTADNISVQYEEVVNKFNIADKVTHVVSDNASNVVKAFKLPGYNANYSYSDDTSEQQYRVGRRCVQ